jgi:hypothetical protein
MGIGAAVVRADWLCLHRRRKSQIERFPTLTTLSMHDDADTVIYLYYSFVEKVTSEHKTETSRPAASLVGDLGITNLEGS